MSVRLFRTYPRYCRQAPHEPSHVAGAVVGAEDSRDAEAITVAIHACRPGAAHVSSSGPVRSGQRTATTASISTGMSNGNSATPIAERAWCPASPHRRSGDHRPCPASAPARRPSARAPRHRRRRPTRARGRTSPPSRPGLQTRSATSNPRSASRSSITPTSRIHPSYGSE